ncbi:zf-CCHC domain-containing protein [Tanacetum coccineum]
MQPTDPAKPKDGSRLWEIRGSEFLRALLLNESKRSIAIERIERFVITSSRRAYRSDDEEYAMAVRNFKKFFRIKGKFVRQPREGRKSFRQKDEKKGKSDRKCFRYEDPNHLIGDCPKPSRNKDQKSFIGGS